MSQFAALDAMMLDAAQAAFGDRSTLYPMKPGAAGLNGGSVADPDRVILIGVPVIRSEWNERAQLGGRGMPMPPGNFGQGVSGTRHVATVKPAALGWVPGKGDELEYEDRPGIRYRVAEPMPDGLSGLHLSLTRI
ncbi:hypothetical protein FG93_05492 [Bosea sp. LC85]|uniref:hypothetical protein n=1 Tax=Bosea sp. LC85 TaxID=1502851 RepID=UPI0004E2E40E|nr:hypothetical protein [Bosea sp. LC85]KFC63982.1 hypothetical protein FG93_05492 [Bosea sp. LC85]